MFEEKKSFKNLRHLIVKELVMGLTVIQKAIQYKIKSQDKKKTENNKN